ncbi:MAG TPA: hypothetical protein VEF04_04195 [Blastocatellia bacterium]|nr:hypothetical protein [Blastocatellia bacterium]
MPSSPQNNQLLAAQLVKVLNAPEESVRMFQICQKYPHPIIYRALRLAQTVPEAKIRKSRLALFVYLVKHYAHHTRHHLGP